MPVINNYRTKKKELSPLALETRDVLFTTAKYIAKHDSMIGVNSAIRQMLARLMQITDRMGN
mgnify:CR=1 FL=1